MTPSADRWDSLRLAARAADREKAAATLRPAFEERLKELGYGPGAIAQAYCMLTGPATVAETLAGLEQNARLERGETIALAFEAAQHEPSSPAGDSLTITSVERDGRGIQIRYTIGPPLPPRGAGLTGAARDDCGYAYRDLGGGFSLEEPGDRTTGWLTMPLPHPRASMLRVRVSWARDPRSSGERSGHVIRITL